MRSRKSPSIKDAVDPSLLDHAIELEFQVCTRQARDTADFFIGASVHFD